MINVDSESERGRLLLFGLAVVVTTAIAVAPRPAGLSLEGQYAIATMAFAGFLWVTGALPLAVTALSIPVLLTGLGVYGDINRALAPFADRLIFLFIAGFVLANALQAYDIDRRVALWLMAAMGSSPRRLVGAVMIATAFFSMWVSNTATAAMMAPIAVGVVAQVLGREAIRVGDDGGEFTNFQISILLGTAYAASVGGVGTLIGSPPNAILAGQLDVLLGFEITFFDWLLIGVPIVVVTLPIVWFVLTYVLYPPESLDTTDARTEARRQLENLESLSRDGRMVATIFGLTASFWVIGGLGPFVEGFLSDVVYTTLFGGSGETLTGTANGHQGLLYYVMVGLYAIPALVLFDTVEWDELSDIDWGTLLLFGGGLSLAGGFAETGATKWIAESVFGALTDAPIIVIVLAVVLLIIFLTEMTSNTATSTIIIPVLISIGSALAATLGLVDYAAAIFLSVSGAIAASFAFALPVATPPNAIVFGTGYLEQRHMLRAGVVLNLIMSAILTLLITLLFYFVWPVVLW